MIQAVIFDCFGVLVREWLAALAEPYPKEVQQQLWDVVKTSNMGFIDFKEGTQRMADVLGLSVDELLVFRNKNEVRNESLLKYVAELKQRGYKTAVLSNVSAGGLARRFDDEELKTLFDAVVESGALGVTKPDKKAYDYTAELLSVSNSSCVMVDDREDFCAGAEAAGMGSLLYSDFASFKEQIEQLLTQSE